VTWVIGMPGFLSGGAVLSDIRITVVQGQAAHEVEGFGVRKLYPVAANMALGFAGSIPTGFGFVRDLTRFLGDVPEGYVASPSRTIWHWSRRLRYHWTNTMNDAQRAGGSELLFMGASVPTHPIMTPSHGFILRAPQFELEKIPHLQARSIGSGSVIAAYSEELVKLGEDPWELLKFEGPLGGPLTALRVVVSEVIETNHVDGISSHLHMCMVQCGQFLMGTNDQVGYGEGAIAREMPPVAESWPDFMTMAAQHGLAETEALSAVC
jgi:hypothetical protein